LIATDQGSDDRGSRPIGNVLELMFEIKKDAWYGWPDFIGGIPVTDEQFVPTRGPKLEFILGNHKELPEPEKPLLKLPANSTAAKFGILPETHPMYLGQTILALFGDEKPMTATAGLKSGRNLSRIDPLDWSHHPMPELDLDRPIDVKYNRHDDSILILDFGAFEMSNNGVEAQKGTGKVWKVNANDIF
jgi:hypothetical protein